VSTQLQLTNISYNNNNNNNNNNNIVLIQQPYGQLQREQEH